MCKVRMYSRNGLLFLYIHARWSNQQPPAPRDYHHHITLYHNNTTEARHYLLHKARLLTNSCWKKSVASVAATALLVRTRGQEVSIFCMNIEYWSHFIATYQYNNCHIDAWTSLNYLCVRCFVTLFILAHNISTLASKTINHLEKFYEYLKDELCQYFI